MQAIQWGGTSATDPLFLKIAREWVENDGEIYVMAWFHRAAGTKHHWLLNSFAQFASTLTSINGCCTLDVYRSPRFPVRGIVNDDLVEQALAEIRDGEDWFLMVFEENNNSKIAIVATGDNAHAALREELSNCVGKLVVIGPDIHWPVAPHDYPGEWVSGKLNASSNAVSAL